MKADKYTLHTYGVGIALSPTGRDYDEIAKRQTAALARALRETKESVMASVMKPQWKFHLSKQGLLILAARASYAPKPSFAQGGTRKITLSVYAKVEGTKLTTMGSGVRTWEELQERMEVPANTSHSEQKSMMEFMMKIVSVREGLDYRMRDTVSTRPPLVLKLDAADEARIEMEEYCMQDVMATNNLRGQYGV